MAAQVLPMGPARARAHDQQLADVLRSGKLPPPPHSLPAEKAILGACIGLEDVRGLPTLPVLVERQRRALLMVLALLRPEHFYHEPHAKVFQGFAALSEAKTPVDLVSLEDWLSGRGWLEKVGGREYLRALVDAPFVAANARAHCLLIERKWRLRETLAAAERLAAEIRFATDERSEEDLLSRGPVTISEAAHDRIRQTCVTLRDAFSQSLAEIDRARGEMVGYRTGIGPLDALTGGLMPAEVLLVKAPKKSGKSVMVGQCALSVAQTPRRAPCGHCSGAGGVDGAACGGCGGDGISKKAWRWRGGLIFALEGKISDWSSRLACSEARLDYDAMLKGQWGAREFDAFTAAANSLSLLPIRIEPDKRLTIAKVAARVREAREEMLASPCGNCGGRGRCDGARCEACGGSGAGIDLAFVGLDYAQLVQDQNPSTKVNREQFLSRFVSELMELAAEPDLSQVAWLVTSQMNADGEARESRAIEMHVDRVWRLWVDKNRRGSAPLGAHVNVEASRRGPQGEDANASFYFQPEHTVFF